MKNYIEIRKAVETLSYEQLRELADVVLDRMDKLTETKPLTEKQIALVNEGENIAAIKDYREMHHSSLREAHVAIKRQRKVNDAEM